MRCIWIMLLVAGCGYFERHKEKDGPDGGAASLAELHAGVLEELKAVSDPATGWPSATDCDGMLWAGEARAAGAVVDLDHGEYASGVVHRRPKSVGPCWTPEVGDVGSKSTVSRDMLTGYLWGRLSAGELGALERLADRGQEQTWIMGAPLTQPEVYLGENLKGILCRAISRECDSLPPFYPPVTADYERHLQVLGILLQGETTAAGLIDINGAMLERLADNANSNPGDGLFAAAHAIYTGDYAHPITLLTDPDYQCPSYVRGSPNYCLVHKAFAMWLVLKHHGESNASP